VDVSFLTPLGSLFAIAAAVPLAALLVTERRASHVRRMLSLTTPPRRALAPVVLALVLLPALVAVAAAQPVVVRQRLLSQRADAQAFFVFDTSRSMSARAPGGPSRLARAKREALQIVGTLGDIPAGIASMTDRTLPNLMPTTDSALFRRTLTQSVAVNRPPPSQRYPGRATTLEALVPIGQSHFFSTGVRHRLLVVFTDGESSRLSSTLRYGLQRNGMPPPVFVHVWAPDERVFVRGKVDGQYAPDPTSAGALEQFASLAHGRVFGEHDLGALAATLRAAAGSAPATTQVEAHARVALAPWFLLGAVAPLALLLWRRNL
jgi:hypothetical protein